MKNNRFPLIVFLAVLLILNILFFIWVGLSSGVSILSYATMTIAYFIFGATLLPRKDGNKVWSWPISFIALLFLILEIAAGVALSLLTSSMLLAITAQLVIILCFILWSAPHVAAFLNSRRMVQQQEENAVYVKNLTIRLKNAMLLINNDEARNAVEKLADTIWCSPHGTKRSVADLEATVARNVTTIEALVAAAEWEQVAQLAKSTNVIAAQRNNLLK